MPADALSRQQLDDALSLCTRAYDDSDISSLYATFVDPVHVLGYLEGEMATHAMWVTRWLQAGDGPLLRTAYVELVATDPGLQGKGMASRTMQVLQENVQGFDLAALWPNFPDWYRRLGWEEWRGRLFIRAEEGPLYTPEDRVMIHRLPASPPLDLDTELSAEWRPGELW